MNPRKLAEQALKENGFRIHRNSGGNHDLYIDPITKEVIPLSRSSHFNEEDLKMIKREIRKIVSLRKEGAQ